MDEYIKRDFALDVIKRTSGDYAAAFVEIAHYPAADVASVVHGRWEYDHTDHMNGDFAVLKCSECGYRAYAISEHVMCGNYCPMCGAKMDGGTP